MPYVVVVLEQNNNTIVTIRGWAKKGANIPELVQGLVVESPHRLGDVAVALIEHQEDSGFGPIRIMSPLDWPNADMTIDVNENTKQHSVTMRVTRKDGECVSGVAGRLTDMPELI